MSHLAFSLQVAGPKAGAPGVSVADGSPAGAPQPNPGGAWTMLFPLLVFVPIIFMQFRRQKKETEARGKLKKGDTVSSQSGLIGELQEMDDKVAKVKIAPGVTVRMMSGAIIPFDAEPSKQATPDRDAKVALDKK